MHTYTLSGFEPTITWLWLSFQNWDYVVLLIGGCDVTPSAISGIIGGLVMIGLITFQERIL
jgi:hypothetical protein